jgi:hypothetical protein
MVRPETVLRWHRDLIAARHARMSRPKRVDRPPTVRSIRVLVLPLARGGYYSASSSVDAAATFFLMDSIALAADAFWT